MDKFEIDVEAQFAEAVDIPCTTVNQWTCQKAVVRDHYHIWKLCKFFKVGYEYLMYGIGLESGELEDICEKYRERIEELERKYNYVSAENKLMSDQISMPFIINEEVA